MSNYAAVPEFYDAEYQNLAMLKRDVPFFNSWLEGAVDGPAEVLEVGVGTGRTAVQIALAGHRVLGFDRDPALLRIAERRRAEAGLDETRLALVEADALELVERDLGRRFDVAAVFFNTFLGFTTTARQRKVLRGIRRHLRPGGRLWLDLFNPDFELLTGSYGEGGARELSPVLFEAADGRQVMRLTHIRGEATRQVQHVTVEYRWIEAGRRRRLLRRFDITWLMPRELRLLLRTCGLRVERIWGDYDGSSLSGASPRILVEARCSGGAEAGGKAQKDPTGRNA